MVNETHGFSAPRWRLTRWLATTSQRVPDDVRAALIAQLFGTLPIFLGGMVNTMAIAVLVVIWHPSPLLIAWCCLEITVSLSRLAVMIHALRAVRRGGRTFTDLTILLAVAWGFTTGLGAGLILMTGDWPTAIVVCISAAGMTGGMCFRYVGAPRLATAVIAGALLPATVGALLSGNTILLISAVQAPALLLAMSMAAFQLHRMLVATMMAERENLQRTRVDALTGLANRAGLIREFETRLAAGAPEGKPFALLYLDLDGFKAINDTHGHLIGDRILAVVAERMRTVLAPGDMAGRLGGDEFVILAAAGGDTEALALGRDALAAISAPYLLADGHTARIGVSIGIAIATQDGRDWDTLMARADTALYVAKARGKAAVALASEVDGNAQTLWEAMRRAGSDPRDQRLADAG
ncbi:MAG: GGDEF domain-containing protein [Phreatobacter sp.]|uniref:GGDEF domain-containing protein n=1 Tax=Phreatobacter sp. TaxID=1966341 RepID=UPI002735FFCB|nr:GGDEF domain-containing protein [Phreatobacter sp.]MDP2802803.1 GGDEF domain-containing protein [Phreatobacter sp.]